MGNGINLILRRFGALDPTLTDLTVSLMPLRVFSSFLKSRTPWKLPSSGPLKKRYCYLRRANSRNSTRQHEGTSPSRRILRFHPDTQRSHFRKSLPTVCIRSLGANERRPS